VPVHVLKCVHGSGAGEHKLLIGMLLRSLIGSAGEDEVSVWPVADGTVFPSYWKTSSCGGSLNQQQKLIHRCCGEVIWGDLVDPWGGSVREGLGT
jgi:hypothetical protein